MSKNFCITVAVLALLTVNRSAHTAIVQWDLLNVTDGSGGTVTGFFDWNTSWSGAFNIPAPAGGSYSFTINEPAFSPSSFTLTPTNSVVFLGAPEFGFNIFDASNSSGQGVDLAVHGTVVWLNPHHGVAFTRSDARL